MSSGDHSAQYSRCEENLSGMGCMDFDCSLRLLADDDTSFSLLSSFLFRFLLLTIKFHCIFLLQKYTG